MATKKQSATKRILSEAKELAATHGSEGIVAAPLDDDMYTFHFTLVGPPGGPFEDGVYHGKILLPAGYPFEPPDMVWLTPNGRWETHRKICLTFTGHHSEMWQPAWGMRTALLGVQALMGSDEAGSVGLGAIKPPEFERRRLARLSREWTCDVCKKPNHALLEEARRTAPLPAGPSEPQAASASPPSPHGHLDLQTSARQNMPIPPPIADGPASAQLSGSADGRDRSPRIPALPSTLASTEAPTSSSALDLASESSSSRALVSSTPGGVLGSVSGADADTVEPPKSRASGGGGGSGGSSRDNSRSSSIAQRTLPSPSLSPSLSPVRPRGARNPRLPSDAADNHRPSVGGSDGAVRSLSQVRMQASAYSQAETQAQAQDQAHAQAQAQAQAQALLDRVPQLPSTVLRARGSDQRAGPSSSAQVAEMATRSPALASVPAPVAVEGLSATFLEVRLLERRAWELQRKRVRIEGVLVVLVFVLAVLLVRALAVPETEHAMGIGIGTGVELREHRDAVPQTLANTAQLAHPDQPQALQNAFQLNLAGDW